MSRARDKVQQVGLWDSQVSLPTHDEICRWVYENADAVLRGLRPDLYSSEWAECDFASGGSAPLVAAFRAATPKPAPRILKKEWEYPLVPGRGPAAGGGYGYRAPVGYGDVLLVFMAPLASPSYDRNDEIEGFHVAECPAELLIEVKTELPTLGELLRQLKLYGTVFRGQQAVVAPDARYAEILREQGFGFMLYRPGA